MFHKDLSVATAVPVRLGLVHGVSILTIIAADSLLKVLGNGYLTEQ